MKIEITAEQFNQIQNEIIRLEEEKQDTDYQYDTWRFIWINDEIKEKIDSHLIFEKL